MMRAQHFGTCEVCGNGYTLGDYLAARMVAMGTPQQRWVYRHAACPEPAAALDDRADEGLALGEDAAIEEPT